MGGWVVRGVGGRRQSIMLKYVPFPLWSAGPPRVVVCAAVAVLASWLAPSPTRASLCVTALGEKQVEAEMKGREGEEEARCTEIGLLFLLISWMNQWMLFCALFLLTQLDGDGGGGEVFVQLPMAWQLEFEFSSLCHYYTPPITILLAAESTLTREHLCIHTRSHAPSPSCKMHLSPVVLWHWTVS